MEQPAVEKPFFNAKVLGNLLPVLVVACAIRMWEVSEDEKKKAETTTPPPVLYLSSGGVEEEFRRGAEGEASYLELEGIPVEESSVPKGDGGAFHYEHW